MADINEQHLLDEILFDIDKKDLLKARLVLASLSQVSRNVQKQALFEVSRADADFAIPLLAGVIVNDPELAELFPQLRETFFSMALTSSDTLLDLLSKEEKSPDKAFLAEVAGQIRLEKAGPLLNEILVKGNDSKTIEKAITALGIIGHEAAVSSISEYLYSGTRELVIASVGALGVIASPEAMRKLADRVGGDSDVDFMILDVISRIQLPETVEILNEIMGSEHAHLRVASKQRLGAIGVTAVRVLTRKLLSSNSDLVIHSLNVLSDIGDVASIPAIRELLNNEPQDPNVRFAAYEALGRLPLSKGAYVLAVGLEDPVDNVRAAAAKAIDKNYNAMLGAGIRNMTGPGDADSMKIISSIVDSECDNIFLGLLEDDSFQRLAIKHLADNASPDICSHFVNLLAQKGYSELAGQITVEGTPERTGKPRVFAVDDSRMVLSIYRKTLHNLGCDSQLFEFPAGALEKIRQDKPDVILTDLNMPDISGIELTKRVRQTYGKDELPIIMVTTQSEGQDSESAYAAGVNGILQKPFSEDKIGKALSEFVDNMSM